MNSNVLIADPDHQTREMIAQTLHDIGFQCKMAADGEKALELVNEYNFDILILNVNLKKWSGLNVLERICKISPKTLSIILSDNASTESAVEALRQGAIDYFVKPVDPETLSIRIKKIIKYQSLLLENHYLRQEVHSKYNHAKIIGSSQSMKKVFKMIEKVACSTSNVLITGKSGTGKEVVARAIHNSSPRKDKPFVPINCGAIPENLFESELFGVKKGSFTGATMDKDGVFKAANEGTLFLDEVGEIPLHIQVKLLRAIEGKEVKPIGSPSSIQVNTRILSATNRNLVKEIENGNFREDLYYRLNIIEIQLPPLKERREDIPMLVDHFIHKYNAELNRNVLGVDNETMKILMNYEWKGEVRELENIIERAVLLCETEYITLSELPPHTCTELTLNYPDDLKESVRNFERQHIMSILRREGNDKNKCAKALNIGLSSLYRKIDELDIKM
ncbi:MAG: sigma-54-dependent Fis family transcriptional regulator [Candidatus Marinimicrobia bacterium]|nr:sigma-54-dependent Fis family transcriptional regulator [Candidatus Neomarinimicrobiota bacterium]